MIQLEFLKGDQVLIGFEAKGHSLSAPKGEDVICAFVSSACLMSANTITEVLGLKADAEMSDGYLRFRLRQPNRPAADILEGLRLHLETLSAKYPNNINVIISEV